MRSMKSKGSKSFSEKISYAISEEDGKCAAYCLRAYEKGKLNCEAEFCDRSCLPDSWLPVIDASLEVKKFLSENGSVRSDVESAIFWEKIELSAEKWEELHLLQVRLVQAFCGIFGNLKRWSLPILYFVSSDLRYISALSDSAQAREGRKGTSLEEAARRINKAFMLCAIDRVNKIEVSRKWGTYSIVIILFWIYFKLSQTSLCAVILKSISASQLPPLEEYPVYQQATFKYYLGVLEFHEEHYLKAEEYLRFTFENASFKALNSTSSATHINKLLILGFLIPLRISMGQMPSKKLLEEWKPLAMYGGFAKAIKTGDLLLYDKLLRRYETLLIRIGTYFFIERMRILALRVFLKKIWVLNKKESRVQILLLQRASKRLKIDISLEELMCLIVNLVNKGLLKGYISYEKATLVMAKGKPFPKIGISADNCL